MASLRSALCCLVLPALLAAACRGAVSTDADEEEIAERQATGDPDAGNVAAPARWLPRSAPVESRVVAGPYARDARFAALAALWPARVESALARLPITTGLGFSEGPPPLVALAAFGDERVPFELRPDVTNGRKRVAVYVNAEPLLGGREDLDRTLMRALGSAALEDAAMRHGEVDAWAIELAGLAAAGDLDERLERLHRAFALGHMDALRVDPEDNRTAVATAAGALLLLGARASPTDVRKLLAFVAAGDDAHMWMGRLAGEGEGWAESARIALHARLRTMDDRPWNLLARAERAFAESGRAGLESTLPAALPAEIRDEVAVLRARAALDVGDTATARSLLSSLPADAARHLRDPAALVLLRVEADRGPGGDLERARLGAQRLCLDHPQSDAAKRCTAADPLLGWAEDPHAWLAAQRVRLQREGTGNITLEVAAHYGRLLLMDQRQGAAEAFLLDLGRRAGAPELEALARAVGDAQVDPSPAAKARAGERFAAWQRDPTPTTRQDVLDGGMAAAAMLVERVRAQPALAGPERKAMLAIAAEAAGPARGLRVIERMWTPPATTLVDDVWAVLSLVDFDALLAAIGGDGWPALSGLSSEALLDKIALGLPIAWLEAHPRFLALLASPSFDDRRRAFEALVADESVDMPPELLAHVLRDESLPLRTRAVEEAGRLGLAEAVLPALEDPAESVRRFAIRAYAQAAGRAAVPVLVGRLERDPAPEARSVAAFALLDVAGSDASVLLVLLRTLRDEDARLREPLAAALARAPRVPLADALARALAEEARHREPRSAYVFRLATVFERAGGAPLGWKPGLLPGEVAAMSKRASTWAHHLRGNEVGR